MVGGFRLAEISILMPCYNESKTIKKNIGETIKAVKEFNNGSFEIIVIDDGSSDDTYEQIKAGANNNGYVKFVRLEQNYGKGRALRKGFEHAQGKYICFLDGDLDIHPRLIKSFIDYMDKEDADVVIGSKRHPLSVVNYPSNRKIASVIYQGFVKSIFNLSIRDSQVGLKLFKRQVLDDVFHRVVVKKYAFDIELLVNAHHCGYKIIEAPIKMDFLNLVDSEVDLRAILRMFLDTCAIYYRLNITHYYDDDKNN